MRGQSDDPTTEELRIEQSVRERTEREAAERAPSDDTEQHAARADKAAYLRERLDERARSERKAEED